MPAYFHVWATAEEWAADEFAFDLDEGALEAQVLRPWWDSKSLIINGRPTDPNTLTRLNVFRSEEPASALLQRLRGMERALDIEPEGSTERRVLGLTANVTAEYLVQPPPQSRPRLQSGAAQSRSLPEKRADRRSVLLIHGPRSRLARGMRTFLNALDLSVYTWSEVAEKVDVGTPDARQILDKGFAIAHAAVVLLEPDDLVSPHPLSDEDGMPPDPVGVQPHPSVLFEAGLAWQKDRSRTLFVEFGHVREFRSLEGLDCIKFDGTPASRHKLASRLEGMKCRVSRKGESWLDEGSFPPPNPRISLLERVPLRWTILAYLAEVRGQASWSAGLDLSWIRSQTGARGDAIRTTLQRLLDERLIEPVSGPRPVSDGSCRITDKGLTLLSEGEGI